MGRDETAHVSMAPGGGENQQPNSSTGPEQSQVHAPSWNSKADCRLLITDPQSLPHLGSPEGECVSRAKACFLVTAGQTLTTQGFLRAQLGGSAKKLRSRKRPTSCNKRLRRAFQSRKSLAGAYHSLHRQTRKHLCGQPHRLCA